MAAVTKPDVPRRRKRRIPQRRVDWAQECDRILMEYGSVHGSRAYPERHRARWKARYVIRLLVESGLRARSELREHTDRGDGGYTWAVEYVGPDENVGRGQA
jgi:hypothetical protein